MSRTWRRFLGWLKIRPCPVEYRGVHFASTLEADWAATLDEYNITWSYEPIALRLSDGQIYRCDFYIRAQRVWIEVKGPHGLRVDKPLRLWRDLYGDSDNWRAPLVLIGREPESNRVVVERADGAPCGIERCSRCEHFTFIDYDGPWQCRICGQWDEYMSPTSVIFRRAPRPERPAVGEPDRGMRAA